ncbi:MAG: nicotinate-nucleotide adenylyltransferase [Furfurilactobacillus sp.]|jgi:nicotinate-nucleotide adenylyltransferase|uniref:Probable nicotinate-nucleotide adenylyltransferase n=1 Tax=Furfurilactobacillus milii TaxID=2888272 RepID=A0ABT6D8P2_9LACO|nr:MULTISPECIES: nicotinate-nucleotide adenylyltransferase [Furfurilactobacillus]QLE66718.1 Nicotinate-nucleotide adenylyltransferase [Furfurilactobacillus rossiae]MCF6160603.1 nicotinate-nucleotide adenylyltransferase [Furfurilactobacillus milii]MCF6162835.1 nicotinate-nucleotide adenylyltransferase [Furfurilactobacillus milii]MCF6420245.1 nicotinate-nucleotide adenylyltransferase [Furfurilactobacillus milii]MCH4010514.1 nicotinate-nucleotide adenylyltransferase [Furfurilactobacillus sp.]
MITSTLTTKQTGTQVMTEMVTEMPKQRVGILGGTFNPPHLGHLIIADQVGKQLGLNKVLFMPNAQPPHIDPKLAIDPLLRARMVRRAIFGNPLFDLEMSEIQRGGKSYTYDTMVDLKTRHPKTEYYFIIGGDEVAYLPKWHRIDELAKIVTFVGVGRAGYKKQTPYPVIWVDVPTIDISSSMIRDRVKRRQSIHYLVPEAVEAYIKEHQLYHE